MRFFERPIFIPHPIRLVSYRISSQRQVPGPSQADIDSDIATFLTKGMERGIE
jgi:hypothetical protein